MAEGVELARKHGLQLQAHGADPNNPKFSKFPNLHEQSS